MEMKALWGHKSVVRECRDCEDKRTVECMNVRMCRILSGSTLRSESAG